MKGKLPKIKRTRMEIMFYQNEDFSKEWEEPAARGSKLPQGASYTQHYLNFDHCEDTF
jgi:hypothetical protein